ncbi:unnamed protein product [Sphagnum balticum]
MSEERLAELETLLKASQPPARSGLATRASAVEARRRIDAIHTQEDYDQRQEERKLWHYVSGFSSAESEGDM